MTTFEELVDLEILKYVNPEWPVDRKRVVITRIKNAIVEKLVWDGVSTLLPNSSEQKGCCGNKCNSGGCHDA